MKKNKLTNYGLGLISDTERSKMLNLGIIKTKRGTDYIVADYPKLVITKSNGDSSTVDLDGDLRQLEMEKESTIRKGMSCRIEYYPRGYMNWVDNQEKYRKACEMEKQATSDLTY